jgi:ribosome biogenesis GTPase / thiamine phosphate phosphatase
MPSVAPSPSLADLGWDDDWAATLEATVVGGSARGELVPGRVARVDRGLCTVLTATGPERATMAHDMRISVGDWVALAPALAPGRSGDPGGRPVVAVVLPRRTVFRRGVEGSSTADQVVAANIDTVFVVNALDARVSIRRIERYLALTWQSGATPVVLLTKTDAVDPDELARAAEAIDTVTAGTPVHQISVTTGQGIDELAPYLTPGRTVALLGLSGAGKSTLVNRLAGEDLLATAAVRADGKGRHTTTHRQLVPLPAGGLLLDTPGMRAISMWDATEGVQQAFADIEQLLGHCRFADCSHRAEPGCEVLAALADGRITAPRLDSWRKLHAELEDQDARQAVRLRADTAKEAKASLKAARARIRS